jgi:hypothetical protein
MAFEPSEGSRRSALKQAAKHLPPGTELRSYVVGTGNARLTTGTMVAIGIFGVVFVVALLLGQLVFPGLLLVAFVWASTRPPRGVVLTDAGVAIFGRSHFNGKPDRLLVQYPYETFVSGPPLASAGKVTMRFGMEEVTFSRKELERLAAGVSAATGRPLTHPLVATAPPM